MEADPDVEEAADAAHDLHFAPGRFRDRRDDLSKVDCRRRCAR